jgi:predicted ATPase
MNLMAKNAFSSSKTLSYPPSIFSGREKELHHLNNLFSKMKKGSGSVVVITGEAGTGKTALVQKFMDGIQIGEIRFVSETFKGVANYEPYAPFLKIIGKLGGANVSEMIKTFSSVSTDNIAISDKDQATSGWNIESLYSLQTERGLIQQKLVKSLLEACKEKPLIIYLGDVYLAPLSAWQFIHYLTHSVIDNTIMILITLRQDGKIINQEQVPVYADILHRMNRERLIQKINLNRFNQAETRKFIRAVFPRADFSNKFLPLLFEVTEGLPQQLCHVLQKMHENNIIYEQDNIWFNEETISKEQLLELLRDDITVRAISLLFKGINSFQKILLEYGAVFYDKMDHRLLSLVLRTSPIKILKELQFLVEKKILISTPEGVYQFKKPAIRSYLLDKISHKRRNFLHREMGKAVEQVNFLEKSKKIYLLAYHYSRTNDINSAIKYLHQAGDDSIQHFAFSEARDYYSQAIELMQENSFEGSRENLVSMLLKAAWVGNVLGNREWSISCCESARRLNKGDSNKSIDAQIMLQEGFTYLKVNQWNKAKRSFNNALDPNLSLSDINKSLVNYGLGTIYFELAEYNEAKKYFEISLEIAKKLNSEKLIATTLNHLGALENVRGNGIRAIMLYSQSIPLFQKANDQAGLARIYHNIGITHAEERVWKAANDFFGKSLAISDTMGLLPLKSITFLNRAFVLSQLANYEEAEEYNIKARRLLIQLKDELGLAEYHKIQGVILREKRCWMEAEKEFQTAIKKYYQLENRLGVAETELEWAHLAKGMGDEEKVHYWANKSLNSFKELGIHSKILLIKKEFSDVYKNETVEV